MPVIELHGGTASEMMGTVKKMIESLPEHLQDAVIEDKCSAVVDKGGKDSSFIHVRASRDTSLDDLILIGNKLIYWIDVEVADTRNGQFVYRQATRISPERRDFKREDFAD